KLPQKFIVAHAPLILLSKQSLFDSNFPGAAYRHHMWFTDIRYLVQLDGSWVYSICVIEGYSRKILAGMVSPHQDLTAILQMLYAALSEYGCPKALVSANGRVVLAG